MADALHNRAARRIVDEYVSGTGGPMHLRVPADAYRHLCRG